MRKSFALVVLAFAGCSATPYQRDHQKLRALESELVIARGDLTAYREAAIAEVASNSRLKGLGERADERLDRAISITHQLTGDE